MKLYYVPGVCSLSPHIVLREGNFDFQLDRVEQDCEAHEEEAWAHCCSPRAT